MWFSNGIALPTYAVWVLTILLGALIIWTVKNKVWLNFMTRTMKRIVVFDLDETLGCFVELGMFWDALNHVTGQERNQANFNRLADMFPEFNRPGIIKILDYVTNMRRKGKCSKVMIYTNNQGPRSWTEHIAGYFDSRLDRNVFDQIIAAFRVRGERVEVCRTTHDKTVGDLIRCTNIPRDTKICFVDDRYHALMDDERVYYINAKPFYYSMPFAEMANRFYDRTPGIQMSRESFASKVESFMRRFNYTPTTKTAEEQRVDEVVSKGMLLHIERFFRTASGRETRRRVRSSRGTRRKRES